MTAELIRPLAEPPLQLAVSRDVRARKLDRDWLVHFRADAPANAGYRLSSDAFSWLMSFGDGQNFQTGTSSELAAARRFIDAGFLISDQYIVAGDRVRLSPDELNDLRGSINTDHCGVLELEGLILYLLAREYRSPGAIVELGSMFGGSTIYLAKGAERQRKEVVAIDDHEWHRHLAHPAREEAVRQVPNTTGVFHANIRSARVDSLVNLIVGDTASSAAMITSPISILFVDADHSLIGLTRDLQSWLPKLDLGAAIAFHDYANDMWPDVRRVVDEQSGLWDGFSVWQTMAIASVTELRHDYSAATQ